MGLAQGMDLVLELGMVPVLELVESVELALVVVALAHVALDQLFQRLALVLEMVLARGMGLVLELELEKALALVVLAQELRMDLQQAHQLLVVVRPSLHPLLVVELD
jgi:hypothetical protein